MLPNDTDFVARKERAGELLREAERERLIELVKLQQSAQHTVRLRVLGWIGGQLIQWGLKLQQDKLN
ncbi:MAG: hypothetical protein HS126_34765 [Anaerolineales bacterium]|nr:hypothetical protein [Anaerolineales bacterium]